jgi:oxygen-dependent protoporphyrinogen oxidase
MIGIIGAGISGLSLAWFLQKKGIPYILLEEQREAGGYIKTIEKEDCLLELGPNSILADNEILSFIEETGLKDFLVPANPVSKERYILKKGKYRKLPSTPPALLFNDFFSFKTKLSIFSEPFKPAREKDNETLSSFFMRRFGKEVVDYALSPFVSGIYAGDPDVLLLEETFPLLKEYERKYGSVIKGFIRNRTGRKQSFTFSKGMQMFPIELSKKLKAFLPGHAVRKVEKIDGQFFIHAESTVDKKKIKCDKLVVTGPAFRLDYLSNLYPAFCSAAAEIEYPPLAVIHSVFSRSAVGHELNGFGSLNPAVENSISSGHIWSSSVFNGRCPQDKVLFTSFAGGCINRSKAKIKETDLKELISKELKYHFNINADPDFQHYTFFSHSIPQYNLEIKEVRELASSLENNGIFFCSNWIGGVSLSDCIKKAKILAQKF